MTLLNAKFSLLGIADVEAFTARIVERSGLRLSAQDREELHVWLIESTWELSRQYRPGSAAFPPSRTRGSGSASSTGSGSASAGHAGSSRAESTSGHGRSSSLSTIPSEIDWTQLSEEAAWTVTHLALPLTCGLSIGEAAAQAGVKTGAATKRMAKLREEIERLSN